MSQEVSQPEKRSGVEVTKENSRYLRGTIALEMANGSDHFGDQDKNLIKFHGFYQQDDRDARKDRHREGTGKYYMFMVRCKIPGGKVTADQYLVLDDLAEKYANSTLRITTRQGIQFHGIIMKGLKETISGINQSLLTTLGACGDVNRNVMAPPAPFANKAYTQLQEVADRLASHFAPRTKGYHEIWVNGEKAISEAPEPEVVEPIYGKVYLPRKFKIGLALPEDNTVDVFAQDLGLLAVTGKTGNILGFNVLVGGGMGMSHGNANTFPLIGLPMCYVKYDQVQDAAEAVIKVFRDHGNRADRKQARIKYLVHKWGVKKFQEVLATYLPFKLVKPKSVEVTGFPLQLGWHEQGKGKFFYGISVENGRIKDEGNLKLRTALRTLVQKLKPSIRLTPLQDILLCDLNAAAKEEIDKTLQSHGVTQPEKISLVQQHSMACPAIPTCGLALSEAERCLPKIIDELEAELKRVGLDQEKISVRMTGCPNGCARPYQSDIGLVGRSGDKYTVFVGGNLVGSRLNFILKDLVPVAEIVPTLRPLFEGYKKERDGTEGFGDYCQRLGKDKLCTMIL